MTKYSILGNYKIESEIGAGGMGVVYKATHRYLKATYAVKILPESFASSNTLIERFHREAQIMSSLSHPNIVKVIDMGVEGNIYYLVMQYFLN